MRLISSVVSLAILSAGLWYVDQRIPSLKTAVLEKIPSRQFPSLEIRYSPQQIVQKNKSHFRHKVQTPILRLAPYLLMHVKHAKNPDQTEECVILWDMTDGEMVLDTKTWEKTHGYGDSIAQRATPLEFQILNAIGKRSATFDDLTKSIAAPSDAISASIENCEKKKLIVQRGTKYRLHMKQPLFAKLPETHISTPLIKMNQNANECFPKRFSAAQIKKAAESAFGDDFFVQSTDELFLPLYLIPHEKPDGSICTTCWNAVTGKRF